MFPGIRRAIPAALSISTLAGLSVLLLQAQDATEIEQDEKEHDLVPAEEVEKHVHKTIPSPVDTDEEVGGEGDPNEKLAILPQIPEEHVDKCAHFHPSELTPEMLIKAKEGPVNTSYTVEIDGLNCNWSVMTVMRMPGETLSIDLVSNPKGGTLIMGAAEGFISSSSDNKWVWRAPTQPGIYCVHLDNALHDEVMCIHVAVLHPLDEDSEYLNGYRIGSYEKKLFQNNPRYTPPTGFIEVTQENQHTWVSPHFQLKQFVCKQSGGFPKYLLLETRLLVKLELLIAELEKSDIKTNGLYLLSAYRTPYYNKSIGNKTSYSRHVYGDAADLFVDSNADGKIDDLDKDGEITLEDIKLLHEAVRNVTSRSLYKDLVGGLGLYDVKSYRNPFLHVDTRGYKADWTQ